jgi:hypothetical protein
VRSEASNEAVRWHQHVKGRNVHTRCRLPQARLGKTRLHRPQPRQRGLPRRWRQVAWALGLDLRRRQPRRAQRLGQRRPRPCRRAASSGSGCAWLCAPQGGMSGSPLGCASGRDQQTCAGRTPQSAGAGCTGGCGCSVRAPTRPVRWGGAPPAPPEARAAHLARSQLQGQRRVVQGAVSVVRCPLVLGDGRILENGIFAADID